MYKNNKNKEDETIVDIVDSNREEDGVEPKETAGEKERKDENNLEAAPKERKRRRKKHKAKNPKRRESKVLISPVDIQSESGGSDNRIVRHVPPPLEARPSRGILKINKPKNV